MKTPKDLRIDYHLNNDTSPFNQDFSLDVYQDETKAYIEYLEDYIIAIANLVNKE